MPATADFYREQAANCAREAAATSLPNQRETFLRAAAAWQAMADRSLRTIEARRQREEPSANRRPDGSANQNKDHAA